MMELKLMRIWTKIKLKRGLQDYSHKVADVVVETEVKEIVEVAADVSVMMTSVKASIAIARESLRVIHGIQEVVVAEETLLNQESERSWKITRNHSHPLSERFNWFRECLRFKQCSRSEIYVELWIQYNFIKLN